jgi:transposase
VPIDSAQPKPTYEELERRVAEQDRRIASLEKQLADALKALEEAQRARKRQAAPFSKGKPKKDPKKPGRKAGDEYGEWARRGEPERIDEDIEVGLPAGCPKCGGRLDEIGVVEQFQTELPPIRPIHRRFRIHLGCCADCGCRVQPRDGRQTSDAVGAAAVQIGPNALAFAALLNKQFGLSWDKIAGLYMRVFAFAVAASTLHRAAARLASRVEPEYDAMRAAVRCAPVANPDETSWKIAGLMAWLWVAVTPKITLYRIAPSRGGDVVEDLLGADFAGLLCRDGWAPYRALEKATHQSCLAHHLARAGEILEVAQRGAARFAHALIRVLKSALDLRDRRDELTGHGFAVLRGKVRAALDRVLAREPEYEPNARFVKHLRNEAPHLLTFLDHPEVEATNWLAEQAIRPAVITRKLSGGGNKTTRGAHVQEVLMSVLRTCVQQGRDALDLFVTAFRAPQPILLGLAPRPPTP